MLVGGSLLRVPLVREFAEGSMLGEFAEGPMVGEFAEGLMVVYGFV